MRVIKALILIAVAMVAIEVSMLLNELFNYYKIRVMENFKSIAFFLVLAVIAFGLIAGIGTCLYNGEYLFAAALAVVAVVLVPTAKWLWGKMLEEKAE